MSFLPAPLTPAEALLLLNPRGTKAAQLFKMSAMALMLRRVLRAEAVPKKGWLGKATTRIQASPGPALPPHEAAVVEVVQAAGRKEPQGATVEQVVAAARRAYGSTLDKYRQDLVLPALLRRGLLEMKPGGLLRLKRPVPTPAGAAALTDLQALLDRGRRVPGWLDADPRQAILAGAALGSLVLLIEELKPHMQRLAQTMAQTDQPYHPHYHSHHKDSGDAFAGAGTEGGGMDGGGFGGAGLEGNALDAGTFDAGAFDAGAFDAGAFDLGGLDMTAFDAGAFDVMESAMTSFDTATEGSSGGGDSSSSSDSGSSSSSD